MKKILFILCVLFSIGVNGQVIIVHINGGGGGSSGLSVALADSNYASQAAGTYVSGYDFVAQMATKQATLVSATNIKTINSTSILGSGNIAVSGSISDAFRDTVQNAITGIFNVLDYGAVGTTGTNNYTAITNAITAAVAAGGGIVFFPIGHYDFGTTLSMNACQGVTLQGQSGGLNAGSELHFTGTGQAITMASPVATYLRANKLSELYIMGSATCTDLFYAKYTGDLTIERCMFTGCSSKAIWIGNSIITTLDDIRTYTGTPNMDYGIYLDSLNSYAQTTTNVINANIIGAEVAGIYLGNCQGVNIIGGSPENCSGWGIWMTEDALLNTLVGVDIEANTLGGLFCAGQGNHFINFYLAGQSRITGMGNIFRGGRIAGDTLCLSSASTRNIIEHCATTGDGAVIDSSVSNDIVNLWNATTGNYRAVDITTEGIYNISQNTVPNQLNLTRYTLGTSGTPAGTNAIKFSLDKSKWYSSARIAMQNRANSDGGSRIILQTHPATWTDTEASYTNALILDPDGAATFANSVLVAGADTTVTAVVGTIVFKTSDASFYGCVATSGNKWKKLNN